MFEVLDTDSLLTVLDDVLLVQGVDWACVYGVDEQGGLRLLAQRGLRPEFHQGAESIEASAPVAAVVRGGQVSYEPGDLQGGLRTLAVAPVASHEGVIGSLVVGSYGTAQLSPESKSTVEGIAKQLGQRNSLEASQLLFQSMSQGAVLQDARGRIVDANAAAQSILGLTLGQLQGRSSLDPRWRGVREDGTEFPGAEHPAMQALRSGKAVEGCVMGVFHPAKQEWRWISVSSFPQFGLDDSRPAGVSSIFEDITEQRQVEQEREILLDVLGLVNAPNGTHELIRQLTRRLRDWSGCEAVGIRLKDGGDFPYYETRGFSSEFVQLENSLCGYDRDGELLVDGTGKPVLQCMCGNVLSGSVDPQQPFFTAYGSFWTNHCGELLTRFSTDPNPPRTRNQCHGHGYESIALIPLRAMGRILGLIQLNDTRPDRFDLRRITLYERLAVDLALGLAQRETTAALRQSEQRWQFALEGSGDGVWDWNPVTNRAYFTSQCKALLELGEGAADESIEAWTSRIHPGDLEQVIAQLQRLLRGETQVLVSEHRLRRREGDWRWVLARGKVMERGPDSRPIRVVGMLSDISIQKGAEAELRDRVEQHQVALDAADLGTWRHDHKTGLVTLDERARVQYGIAASTVPASEVLAQVHPDDVGTLLQVIQHAMDPRRSAGSVATQFRVVRPGGEERWLSVRVLVHFEGSGDDRKAVMSFGTAADVTEQRLATAALQESEYWLRESQRISQVGTYVFDLQRNTWTSSETLDSIFGIGRDFPRTAEGWGMLVAPDQRDWMLTYLREEVMAGRTPFDREYRIRRFDDGEERWVHGRGALTDGANGQPVRMAGTIQDITARKSIEQQLLQAQKMESIGRLAGGIAHDFNNLLTIINGYSNLLLRRLPQEDPSRPALSEVLNAGERAAGLTQQLLAFSRRQVLQPQRLSLNTVVSGLLSMVQRLIGENVELETHLSPDLGVVEADPSQMNQVVLNLVVNARDAMPERGRLIIRTSNALVAEGEPGIPGELRRGRYVSLEVEDEGCGMTDEVVRHLFEPFFTTKPPGKGTGLGLSTVYGIVKQSGGWIDVKTRVNCGTTVRVLLPEASALGEGAIAEQRGSPMSTLAETILLVEDQSEVRQFAAGVLTGYGYRVLEADSGDNALLVAGRHDGPIDLVLSDMVMPGMPLREFLSRLNEQRPDSRILLMSGYLDDAPLSDWGVRNLEGMLQKPFTAMGLAWKVRAAFGVR